MINFLYKIKNQQSLITFITQIITALIFLKNLFKMKLLSYFIDLFKHINQLKMLILSFFAINTPIKTIDNLSRITHNTII